MEEISLSIFSNKCCSRGGNRRQRKLVYIGDRLSQFVASMNNFVLDEQHKFNEEYSFSVKQTDVKLAMTLLRQFAHFSILSKVQDNESALLVLLDDDELLVLLVALHKLADTDETLESLNAVCDRLTNDIQLSRNTLQR